MPPKKIDPEVQKKEFEAWLQTDQYKRFELVHKELKLLPPISETTKDETLSGKFQVLWDHFYEVANLLKIKPPFKRIEHEWIRSIYFGEKKKEKPPYCQYDGVLCQHENVEADSQHNIRQALIKGIYNTFEELKNFDESDYLKRKTDLKKAYNEFFKFMKTHIKKSFKIIYDQKLMIVLQPLINLLQINMKLVMFDIKYQSRQEKIINGFKYKAFVDKYSVCLQEAMRILSQYHNKPIIYTPDVRMIFKKLQYENLTKIQSFYIQPLREAFEKMKKGLASLFSTGINFWKVPLQANTKFVQDLKSLIKQQLITERILGNDLLRDQINFVSNTLQIIVKANPMAQKYMKAKDVNSIQVSIPRLITFKTIQHMRKILDKKLDQKKAYQEKKISQIDLIEQVKEEQKKTTTIIKSTVSNFNKTNLSKNNNTTAVTLEDKAISQEKKLELEERKKYGRYWIWTNYCDEQHRKLFEYCVELLRHINKAIHQDIQDAIITLGMLPKKGRQDEELKEAADFLKSLKTKHNSEKIENMKRPPQLWNFPKIVEEEHKFRSIADPKRSYIDGRIEELDKHIAILADHLRKYNHIEWDELILRVIDFYENKHDSQPHIPVEKKVHLQQSS